MATTYSAGTVFLDVAPSLAGAQNDIARQVKTRYKRAADEAKAVTDEMEREADKSGERAGKKYGSAFERMVKERAPRMREAFRDLSREMDGSDDRAVKKFSDNLKKRLDALDRVDFSSSAGQEKADKMLRLLERDLAKVAEAGKIGNKQLSDMSRVNLGALREDLRKINREMDQWRKASGLAPRSQDTLQKEGMAQARIQRQADDEALRRDRARRAEDLQWMRARRAMDEDFTRRGEAVMTAQQKAKSKEREDELNWIRARKAMDADYNRRAEDQMRSRVEGLRRQLREQQDAAGNLGRMKIGVDISQEDALRQAAQVHTAVEAIFADGVELGVEADLDGAVRSARGAHRAAQASLDSQILKMRTDLETNTAKLQAFELRRQIAALGDDIRWNPDLNVGRARLKAEQLKQSLRSISGSVNVSGDMLRLEGLERQLGRTSTQARKTQGALAALDASGAANSVRVFNGALLATVSIGPLLIPVLGVIATGILGVGAASLGALVGVGALVAGLSGVGGAVKALSELQKAKRTAPGGTKKVDTTRQDVSDARAIADAQKALGKAREGAADAIEKATQRVGTAELALARAREDAAEAIIAADERVVASQEALAKAQASSLAAQQGLNEARAQAVRDLQDMNNQLESARLAERANEFAVEEAAVHLNVVLEDDQATDREKAVAQLAYEQAVQRQKEQTLSLERLEVDTEKANKAGVEGSDRVVRAKEQITSANEGIADAEKALREAVAGAAQERVDQAQEITDAQLAVAEAVQNVADVQTEQAERIADAEERVARVLEDQALRSRDAALGVDALATETTALEEAMRNLSPAGQDFALFLFGLAPLLKDIRFAAQEGLLPGLQESLQLITDTYGPGFVAFIGEMAGVLGDLSIAAGEALTGPWWTQFFEYMAEVMPVFLQQWGELGGNLITFFAGITQAFSPIGTEIMDTLVRGSEIIAEWAQGLKDDPGFIAFLDYMREAAPEVGELFGNLFTILGKLLVGLAPYSEKLLELTIRFTDWLAAMDPDQLARIALVVGGIVLIVQVLAGLMVPLLGFIGIVQSVWGVLQFGWAIITGIAGAFGSLWGWLATKIPAAWIAVQRGALIAIGAIAGISAPIWIVIGVITGLITAFVLLWKNNETFRDKVKEIWGSIVDAWDASMGWIADTALPALGDAWDWLYENHIAPFVEMSRESLKMLGTFFQGLWDIAYLLVLKPLGEAISFLWENWVKPIFGLIAQIITEVVAPAFMTLWTGVIQPTFGFISAIFETTWAVMKTIFDAINQIITYVIGPAFKWLYDSVISPVFGWIGEKISGVWNETIKPIFDLLGGYISDTVAPVFGAAVEMIANIWGALLDFLRTPIRLAIEYVVNKGLIGAFNWLAEKVPGMTKLEEVAIPDALQPGGVGSNKPARIAMGPGGAGGTTSYATGGIIPGYSPGIDNHRFVSDTGLVLNLAGGEPVLRPEAGLVLGEDWVNGINAAARQGGTGGVSAFLGGFAGGGILPKMTGGSLEDFFSAIGDTWDSTTNAIGKFASTAADFISNPADSLGKVVKDAASTQFAGQSSFLIDAGVGVALAPLDAISTWVKELFGDDATSPARSRGGSFDGASADAMGYKAQIATILNQFPGARITSSYRPGAITSVGTKSYHGMGRAIDIAPDMRIASWLYDTFPNSRELIYTPAGSRQIQNGRQFSNFAPITKAQHHDHIHWAMANGGIIPSLYDDGGDLPPGLSMVANKTGKVEHVLTNEQLTEIRDNTKRRELAEQTYDMRGAQFGYDPEEVGDVLERKRRDTLAAAGLETIGAGL